ncbi:unnamed protein product [Porites evermanni]|uniref:Uncharacterized protein n=1 Tax=Porites evermanni TaxID=104178 RepID=A0ABN8PGZ4_9CNID|nr:unnamed protein product [Porites evermanni]
MSLKTLTDPCECCITLTNIKIPRKRNYTLHSCCIGGIAIGSHGKGMSVGLNGMLSRQLDEHTVGYLTYKGGTHSSMNATVAENIRLKKDPSVSFYRKHAHVLPT